MRLVEIEVFQTQDIHSKVYKAIKLISATKLNCENQLKSQFIFRCGRFIAHMRDQKIAAIYIQ